MMSLRFLHLCDNAFRCERGKFNLIGIFKQIILQRLPGGLPRFYLMGGIELPADVSGKFTLDAVLIDPNKSTKKISTLSGIWPERNGDRETDFVFNMEIIGLTFAKAGGYEFVVNLNGKTIGRVKFNVLQLPQKGE